MKAQLSLILNPRKLCQNKTKFKRLQLVMPNHQPKAKDQMFKNLELRLNKYILGTSVRPPGAKLMDPDF